MWHRGKNYIGIYCTKTWVRFTRGLILDGKMWLLSSRCPQSGGDNTYINNVREEIMMDTATKRQSAKEYCHGFQFCSCFNIFWDYKIGGRFVSLFSHC